MGAPGAENARAGAATYPRHAISLDTFMWATTDSATCLHRTMNEIGFCDPIQGTNLLVAPQNLTRRLPVVLAVAQLDSDALVRDEAYGATAQTATVIALLAAVKALKDHPAPASRPAVRDVAFAMFDAESWGYTGSRKWIHDLRSEPNTMKAGPRLII